jgi:uncharacterized protein YraI
MKCGLVLAAAMSLFGAFAQPSVAAAQSIAYTVPYGTSNMRAGPGFEYPVIAVVRGGSAVYVYGCLSDYSWCDSSVQGYRGWISTTRMQFQYAGNLVPFTNYYSYFGAPVIGFDFGYWDRYYYDRPFYRDWWRTHRRHDRRYYSDRPSIPPEEGGGRYRRDQGPPPVMIEPGGNNPFPEEGGGQRHRRYRPPADDQGGGVFPEEGGGRPRVRGGDGAPPRAGSDAGGAGPCPASNPNCR